MLHALEQWLGPRISVLRVYCYGLCMGTADALPGVSGGTVALLLGFYGRLIAAVTALTPGRAIDVARGYDPERRDRAREALLEMDLQFLLPLGVGMVTAVALIAGAVSALSESHPLALFGFFTGLIAASAVVLFRSLTLATVQHALAAAAGTGLALLVAANVLQLPGSGAVLIFLSGGLAISAMILPGVSGALILILLGQYVYLSSELTAFRQALQDLVLAGGTLEAVVDPGTTVVVFVAGGVVGLVTIARVVRFALDRHRGLTLVFLVGLIAGSVPAPLHNVAEAHAVTTETITLTAAWAVLGAVALFALDRLAGGFDPE
jgi:putative membrane protein